MEENPEVLRRPRSSSASIRPSGFVFKGRAAARRTPKILVSFSFMHDFHPFAENKEPENVFFFYHWTWKQSFKTWFPWQPHSFSCCTWFFLWRRKKKLENLDFTQSVKKNKRWKRVEMILVLFFLFVLFFLIPDFSQFHSQHPGESRSSKLRPVRSFGSVHSVLWSSGRAVLRSHTVPAERFGPCRVTWFWWSDRRRRIGPGTRITWEAACRLATSRGRQMRSRGSIKI